MQAAGTDARRASTEANPIAEEPRHFATGLFRGAGPLEGGHPEGSSLQAKINAPMPMACDLPHKPTKKSAARVHNMRRAKSLARCRAVATQRDPW